MTGSKNRFQLALLLGACLLTSEGWCKEANHWIDEDKFKLSIGSFFTDYDSEFSLYDVIQTGSFPSPDDESMKDSLATNINRALSKLTNREAAVLTMSFGLFGSPMYSLNDIAVKYEMSSERIRQIRTNGLYKLKTLLKGNYSFFEE